MINLNNKTALVTGAAVGIGRATAIVLARNGARLVLIDINYKKLEEVKKEVEEYTKDVLIFKCDVSDEEGVNDIVKKALKAFGSIDILVNNAALWRCWDSFLNTSVEAWKKFIDVNIMGVVYCCRAVLPKMLENKWGRIINVSSVAGVYGNTNMVHYSTTKGAVNLFTKALAKEVTSEGVLVNSVCPGSVSPAENSDIDYTQESELSFMGRTGSDRENANLICFLAGDEASYISGQNIQIDGCRRKM